MTDWSSIAYEFSFTTKRPCLFVNTKMKVLNPEYTKIGIEPTDIWFRDRVGVSVAKTEMDKAASAVRDMLEHPDLFAAQIAKLLEEKYSVYKFGEIADLMRHLQKIGVYDKSLIVIAADHGNYMEPAVSKDRQAEDNSILWIKPEGSRGPFRFSTLPTSNCRIAPLVKAAQAKLLSAAEIDGLVEAHDRIFRAKHGTTWYSFGRRLFFYEWQYDDEGHVVRCENLGIFKAN